MVFYKPHFNLNLFGEVCLLNTVYFTTISLFGTLFFSMHKLANAIWINKIQSILLTIGEIFVFLLLFYLILIIGLGNNFDWVGSEVKKAGILIYHSLLEEIFLSLGVMHCFAYFIAKRTFIKL